MESKLSRQLLTTRLHDAVGVNYLSLASIIAGVNLAVAADSLVGFFNIPAFAWDRVPLWLSSFECLVIAYSALTLVPILAIYSPNWRDHVLSLLIGLCVLLLFEVLPHANLIALWYLFAALTCASRVGLARHIAAELRRLECEDDIQQIVRDFTRSMARVARAHLSIGVYFLLVWIGLLSVPGLLPWQWLFGVLGMVALLVIILLFERARARLVRDLG